MKKLLGLMTAAVACGAQPIEPPSSTTTAPTVEVAPKASASPEPTPERAPAPKPQGACNAREQAAELSGVGAESLNEEKPISEGDFDFDGDGVDDIVWRFGSANADHYLFVRDEPCPRFVGKIPAALVFGLGCLSEKHNGLCIITASILMIHGESVRQDYAFDGTAYVKHGPSVMSARPP